MGDDRDKLLFTPGPLTTSPSVKEAMLRDLGSREQEFLAVVAEIRISLLRLACVTKEGGYEAIPMQSLLLCPLEIQGTTRGCIFFTSLLEPLRLEESEIEIND